VEKEVEKIIADSKEHAEKTGIRLNPEQRIVEAISKALAANEKDKGARYCPCRQITGNKEEDKKIICPCTYHLNEIKKDGHCHCKLFVK